MNAKTVKGILYGIAVAIAFSATAATVYNYFPPPGMTYSPTTGFVVGSATGGAQGAGTVNAQGVFVNGAAVVTGAGLPVGANPTGTVGLTAVNGSATTFLRSDGAPPLSQSISPTWTGVHTFSSSTTSQPVIITSSAAGGALFEQFNSSNPTNTKCWMQRIGSTGSWALDPCSDLGVDNNTTFAIAITRTGTGLGIGSLLFGQTTDNPSFAFQGTGAFSVGGGITVGSPTGGNQGTGSINMQSCFVNGVACSTGGAAGGNPTASVGLTAVNGSAGTFLRSDGAPALSQSIAPTWTGTHGFNGQYATSTATSVTSPGQNGITFINSGAGANAKIWDILQSTANHLVFRAVNDAFGSAGNWLEAIRSGLAISSLTFGNSTDNPTFTFAGTGTTSFSGGVTVNLSSGPNFVANATSTHPGFQLNISGARKGFFVEANATNDFCNGTATGDVCLGASSGNIVFSGNDGSSAAATLSSAGIFNVASGGDLRINGTSVRPCIIKITFSGTTPSVASSTGCSSPSVSRSSTGSYTFTDANITGLIAVCTPNSSSGGPYLQMTVSIGSGSSIIDNFAVPGTASVLADIPSGASLTCMFTR